ncbi:50S ribosomal protein L19e [Candidatus Woesearchaeota archaeon]|nr:50S ribosomal protein L19e [Candidatus Woesearchaeota archaeon]
MKLTTQKRIAAEVLGIGINKVKFDVDKLDEIKEAITKSDIRSLVKNKVISKKAKNSQSRARARIIRIQKRKGNRKGPGSKTGTKKARSNPKRLWVRKIRILRTFLRGLKEKGKLENKDYRNLILKSKGGYFRSKRHIKLYITEHRMVKEK